MKTLRELQQELDQLDVDIRLAREHETGSGGPAKSTARRTRPVATAVWSERLPAGTRQRVQRARDGLPGPGGSGAPDYRERAFAAIRKLARAWGGQCVSAAYEGYKVPLEFECAAGHRFPMLTHMLRMGSWCQACAYERATIHSLEEARALAAAKDGQCLSTQYESTREKLRWRCAAGHTWLASLEGVLAGDWCQSCHHQSIKPPQEALERAAAERGGRCLSAYVDKETPLEWQCAEGHIWKAQWFRVKKGQWCHRCAVKARTRTIEQMQEVANSRGGRCLSTVYPGPHGKIDWECAKGHLWRASVNSVWRGSWCPECAWESRRLARNRRRSKGSVPIMV
ncbi:zinc-ribbon domain-containing protein [Paraburkholderia sp. MM5482-R1]|uniref:zinc-ribbon domain-containing protein n=1 Tax=unclassified Paraburkholderia TaxID=2615204 RepID=UPI003D1B872A